MLAWLKKKKIKHDNTLTKPKLYEIIKTHKTAVKYKVDEFLKEKRS